jgi:hypothetical protein
MSSQTSTLSPSWARIIHRLSALGVVETRSSNDIASLSEVGAYPRHIISAGEDSSQTVDGSAQWNYLNWRQGWIQRRRMHHAVENQFFFSSNKNTVFHQLRFLQTKPNDCLNCLLQLFTSNEEIQPSTPISVPSTLGNHWRKLSHILERALESELSNRVKFTLHTEGGLIKKSIRAIKLSETNGSFTLSDGEKNSLQIHSGNITHLQSEHLGDQIQTTLYNSQFTPQAILQHCA